MRSEKSPLLQLSIEIAPGVPMTVNDKPASGAVTLHALDVPKSSDDFHPLLRDKRSQFLREFKGTTWFPVDPAYRVRAPFVPYERPKTVSVPYTGGAAKTFTAPGDVLFRLAGRELRLEALTSGEGLFIMFKDQTSGKETYGGGRFLEAETPRAERPRWISMKLTTRTAR
jgi:uncharacterized protein (DUF1684 family)